jgi:hypothetical protein
MYSFPIFNTFFVPLVLIISTKQQAKMKEQGTTQERMNQKHKLRISLTHTSSPITWKLQRHSIRQNKLLS